MSYKLFTLFVTEVKFLDSIETNLCKNNRIIHIHTAHCLSTLIFFQFLACTEKGVLMCGHATGQVDVAGDRFIKLKKLNIT